VQTYRINVADVPRQRPSTPEEETIDRAVERMAPPCLDRKEGQDRIRSLKDGGDLLFAERGISLLNTGLYKVDWHCGEEK
jgi:hypothetical protein